MSCIAETPAFAATSPSDITLILWINFCAVLICDSGILSIRKFSKSVAKMAVPSRPIAFVTMTSSPGFAPEDVTKASF